MPQSPLTIGTINDANSLPAASLPIDTAKQVIVQAVGSKKREKVSLDNIFAGAGGVGGTGTSGTVAVFAGSATVGDSSITDDGSTVTVDADGVVTGTMVVSGGVTFDSTEVVSGAVTMKSTLVVSGGVTHSGAMVNSSTTSAVGNVTADANVSVGGYVDQSIGVGLTAVGTNQGTGLALTHQQNIVGTAASSAVGVVLPAVSTVGVGGYVDVYNDGPSNSFHVYGNGSDTIDGTAGATGVVLTNDFWCRYVATAAATWKSYRSAITRSA